MKQKIKIHKIRKKSNKKSKKIRKKFRIKNLYEKKIKNWKIGTGTIRDQNKSPFENNILRILIEMIQLIYR